MLLLIFHIDTCIFISNSLQNNNFENGLYLYRMVCKGSSKYTLKFGQNGLGIKGFMTVFSFVRLRRVRGNVYKMSTIFLGNHPCQSPINLHHLVEHVKLVL